MVVHRACKHEPVEECDRDTHGEALFDLTQHAAGGGAVNIEVCVLAPVGCGNHEGLSVSEEADVTQEAFVEDAIDGFTIVDAAVGLADDTGPGRGCEGLGHLG